MVSHLDGGKAVHNNIACVQFTDIDRCTVFTGDQDRMCGKVIHEGCGNNGVLVDGRTRLSGKILITKPSACTDQSQNNDDEQDLQHTEPAFRTGGNPLSKRTGEMPGPCTLGVSAGRNRIVCAAFSKGVVVIHIPDAMPDLRLIPAGFVIP